MSNLKISTKTIIAVSNIECNISELFIHIPLHEISTEIYETDKTKQVKKRRGKKKKNADPIISTPVLFTEKINKGDIVALYYQNRQRGLPQYFKQNQKYFRNALNIIMYISEKKTINFKLSKNGKIQMTGCKEENDAKMCLQYFFELLYTKCSEYISYKENNEINYYTVMTNIDFNIGFEINRGKLNELINAKTEYNSLLETSFGYTGVNIKMPIILDKDYSIDVLKYKNNIWEESQIRWKDFIMKMGPTYEKQEFEKKRYNTFLVFHSGNIIMSGMRLDLMLTHQKYFSDLLLKHRKDIEEYIK